MVAYDDKVMVPGTQMYEMFGPQPVCPNCSHPDVEWDQPTWSDSPGYCPWCGTEIVRVSDCPVMKWGDAQGEHQAWRDQMDAKQVEKERHSAQEKDARLFQIRWASDIFEARNEQKRQRDEAARRVRVLARRERNYGRRF